MSTNPQEFPGLLTLARLEKGWSRPELAKRIGSSFYTVREWERGEAYPRSYFRQLLCKALEKTPEELGIRDGMEIPEELELPTAQPKDTIEAIQEAAIQIAEADPSNIQEVAAGITNLKNNYYLTGLEQSRKSFRASLIFSGIALIFGLLAISVLLLRQPTEVAYASGIGGTFTTLIAGTYLRIYKQATSQLDAFRLSLDGMQSLLLANSICESFDTDTKQKMRIELIRHIFHVTEKTPQSNKASDKGTAND